MRRSVLWMALAVFGSGTFPVACGAQPQGQGTSSQMENEPTAKSAWNAALLASLAKWVDSAPSFGLPRPDTAALDKATRDRDVAAIDREAEALALRLARFYLLGCTPVNHHAAWRIPDTDARLDLAGNLHAAMLEGSLDTFFADLQPRNPAFAVLRARLAEEADPVRKTTLIRNMERWRWMPRDPGHTYLLVNPAAFSVELWRDGGKVDEWRAIVGRKSSPTPIFAAMVSGVTFNPWWDIPPNIVRESVGAMMRNNPDAAARKGYVRAGRRYRQRPGPDNALGVMKLAMPNSFNVYIHDTPSKALFNRPVRAFSHGCVRVDRPLDLAAALLAPRITRADADHIVASGNTVTEPLPGQVPVYIAYFTAVPSADGEVAFLSDIYGRDSVMGDALAVQKKCAF